MKHFDVYYKLASLTMNSCTMEIPAYEEARKTWLCTGCGSPKPGVEAVDAMIQEDKLDNTPLNFVSGCGIGIARRDFLSVLGDAQVDQYLWLGRVFGPDGNLLKKWVTFNGKNKIIIRGSKHVAVRSCPFCQRQVYFAMAPLYLYPEPKSGVGIFDADMGTLVITKEIMAKITLNKWRKIDCDKLPVLEWPTDGLTELTTPWVQ